MPVSCERQPVDFLWKSSWSCRKFWIFSGIVLNDEHSWPLWASATLPVFWNLATKRWIVLPFGTLFLPTSFLYCRCVRRTDFAAKYDSMIFICCCVVSSTWIHIGVKRISQGCCLHHLKNMIQFWDNFKWNLENF